MYRSRRDPRQVDTKPFVSEVTYRIGRSQANRASVTAMAHHQSEWTCSHTDLIGFSISGTAIAYRFDWPLQPRTNDRAGVSCRDWLPQLHREQCRARRARAAPDLRSRSALRRRLRDPSRHRQGSTRRVRGAASQELLGHLDVNPTSEESRERRRERNDRLARTWLVEQREREAAIETAIEAECEAEESPWWRAFLGGLAGLVGLVAVGFLARIRERTRP